VLNLKLQGKNKMFVHKFIRIIDSEVELPLIFKVRGYPIGTNLCLLASFLHQLKSIPSTILVSWKQHEGTHRSRRREHATSCSVADKTEISSSVSDPGKCGCALRRLGAKTVPSVLSQRFLRHFGNSLRPFSSYNTLHLANHASHQGKTLQLEFYMSRPPNYAILSHT
jgi:hypothetical protein